MTPSTRALPRFHRLSVLLAPAALIGACAGVHAETNPPPRATPPLVAATPSPPPEPVQIVTIPTPLPLPGQLKPLEVAHARPEPAEPRRRVEVANDAARVQPDGTSWLNAIQQYPYTDGALYQVYAAPGQVTDIALQEGEELAGPGPVAAGDTVRWIIGDTASGSGTTKRVHILVKPTRPDLTSNLVINTDRRTYHLELRAGASTYMAAVSWTYPQDQLIALRAANSEHERAALVASGIDIGALNFNYRIDGDKPAWRPVRVFDDGRQAYIEFPETIATGEMPPLFVTDADGAAELVNYRARGRFMIVDRLFTAAELRLGTKKSEQRVRIERDDASAKRRRS